MPELCAAVGLAQCEMMNEFVNLRKKMAEEYLNVVKDSDLFISQHVQKGYTNTYWTFAARFMGENKSIHWHEFRKKYMEFGGDGIYAAHQTVNNEPCFRDNKIGYGEVPVAESLQKELMLFTTNQKDEEEREIQIKSFRKTLDFFS